MSRLFKLCCSAFLALLLAVPVEAALDTQSRLETGSVETDGLELIVVEAQGCIYCHIFRRDVLPAYERSKRAEQVPIHFVDINELEARPLELKGTIGLIPTVLLMRGKAEVGRIAGYTGPENFFHAIRRLIVDAGEGPAE